MTLSPKINFWFFYNTSIKPIIQYGILVYGCTSRLNLKSIWILQKKVLRLIHRKRRWESTAELFERHNISTVYELHLYELFKHLILHVKLHEDSRIIHSVTTSYATRSANLQLSSLARFNTTAMKCSVTRRVQVFHNLLQRRNLLPSNLLQMSEYSLQKYIHSFRDNFIIGNAFFVDEIFR